MEFKAQRDDFLAAVYLAQGIVERRHTMPILANVLLEARAKDVRVTATDLEVGVRGKLEGKVTEEGRVTLNAKKLYEIVREVPEETVEVKRLANDWVEIRSGKSVFKMMGLDPQEFPQFPEFTADALFAVPGKTLREMIEKTIFAASTDETRHNLNGVFAEEAQGGKLRMVATDGHRLCLIERGVGSVGLGKGVILPRKGLSEIKKLLDQDDGGVVSLGCKENMGLVVRGEVELYMRLIEGDFPDYSKVVPKGNPFKLRVSQQGFLRALRRVSILSSERYKGVKVELKEGKVAVSASNPDLGEAVEEMEAEYKGKALAIGFNARYLLDVLAVLVGDGEVSVELKDEVSPGLVKMEGDEGYQYVIMPMRL